MPLHPAATGTFPDEAHEFAFMVWRTDQSSWSGISRTRCHIAVSSHFSAHSGRDTCRISWLSSGAIQVGAWMPLVTLRIGTCSIVGPGHICCHISLETCPCSRLTPFTWAASRMASAVMLKPCLWDSEVSPRRRKSFPREAQLLPIAGKVPFHEMIGKYVVTGRHRVLWVVNTVLWRMVSQASACVRSLLDQFANALQCEEAEWPSLACQTVGAMPNARSIRTPPIPNRNS